MLHGEWQQNISKAMSMSDNTVKKAVLCLKPHCPQWHQRTISPDQFWIMFQEMVFWDDALLWENHEKPVFMLRYLTIQEANGLLCVDLVYNKFNNVSEHKKHFPCWVTFRDFRSNYEWQESQQSPVLVGIAAHTFPCGKVHRDRLWSIHLGNSLMHLFSSSRVKYLFWMNNLRHSAISRGTIPSKRSCNTSGGYPYKTSKYFSFAVSAHCLFTPYTCVKLSFSCTAWICSVCCSFVLGRNAPVLTSPSWNCNFSPIQNLLTYELEKLSTNPPIEWAPRLSATTLNTVPLTLLPNAGT